jgi:hypothetical protein
MQREGTGIVLFEPLVSVEAIILFASSSVRDGGVIEA